MGAGITATCTGEGWTYTYAGGIAARNYAEIRDCIASADISATTTSVPAENNDNWPQVLVGGIAGYNDGTIKNSTTSGTVSGKAEGEVFSDPIVGVNDGEIKNCSAEEGSMNDNPIPSDDATESPVPILGILSGLSAALVMRRK